MLLSEIYFVNIAQISVGHFIKAELPNLQVSYGFLVQYVLCEHGEQGLFEGCTQNGDKNQNQNVSIKLQMTLFVLNNTVISRPRRSQGLLYKHLCNELIK